MTRYRHLITDENRKWWTLGAMCFALFMLMLDNTVVNVALPSIERDLGASLSSLEWTVNGYTLAFAVFLATGGRLGDIFGRRLAFLIGVGFDQEGAARPNGPDGPQTIFVRFGPGAIAFAIRGSFDTPDIDFPKHRGLVRSVTTATGSPRAQ